MKYKTKLMLIDVTVIIAIITAATLFVFFEFSEPKDDKPSAKPVYEFVFVRKVDDHYLLYKHRTLNICLLIEPTHSGGKTQIDCSLTEGAE